MNDHSLLKSYGKHCDLWSVSLPLKCQFWQAGTWCSVICKCVSKWDVLISPALWHTVENLLIITTLPQTPVSSTHTTTSGLSSLQFHLQNETRNVCLTNQYILTIELVINKINNITLYLEYYIINIRNVRKKNVITNQWKIFFRASSCYASVTQTKRCCFLCSSSLVSWAVLLVKTFKRDLNQLYDLGWP